jgi:Flp pilus assembly protein CpaB
MALWGFSVADLGTTTAEAEVPATERVEGAGRRIRRARGLPGGRAVVGAFLVAAATVGVFAAFLSATAEPSQQYAVAHADVEVGTRFASLEEVNRAFRLVPMDLPEEVAAQAFGPREAEALVGQLVTSPVREGDLLLRSAVVDDARVPQTEKMSFSLPVAEAVGGNLEPGERIDVLATYGAGSDAWTAFVARGVLLVGVERDAAALGASEEVTLTVAISSLRDVQALGHAVRAAEVFVTRSTVAEGSAERAPGAYRPAPQDTGPSPDPAEEQLGEGAPPPPEPSPDEGGGEDDLIPAPTQVPADDGDEDADDADDGDE